MKITTGNVYIELLPHDIIQTWSPSTVPSEYSSLSESTAYIITALQIINSSTSTAATVVINDVNSFSVPINYVMSISNTIATKIKVTAGAASNLTFNFVGISFPLLQQYGVSIV